MSQDSLFEVEETYTVAQVTRRLGELVRRSFAREVWVQGQIRNLSRSSRGHVYFDLVDPVAAGEQPKALIAVTLFDSNRQIVNRIITRTGNNVRIDDGVEVRIQANVELYAPRGQVQLNMTSIDPDFTLGRLGADREQLLRELSAGALLDLNRSLAMPLVPLRVGLITSEGSAAHHDFHEQLAASGYAFELVVLPARMQGEFAAEEIAEMIAFGCALELDALALVRGGGARTDLATFDTAPVARAIAAATLPVLCGIGHEIDTSVADLVAHLSLKTPTACAQHLIDCVVAFDRAIAERAMRVASVAGSLPAIHAVRLDELGTRLSRQVAGVLTGATGAANTVAGRLERSATRLLLRSEQRLVARQGSLVRRSSAVVERASEFCDRSRGRLRVRPERLLRNETLRLDVLAARLSAIDPAQALRRGYSITTNAEGRVVRTAADVAVGESVVTRLAHGAISSTVSAVYPPPSSLQENP